MEKASTYILEFLYAHAGIYHNPQKIEVVLNYDDSVIVNYLIKDPPQAAYIEFGMCYENDNFNDFMRDFRIARPHELTALSPDHLWELYYKGKAEVYCLLAEKVVYMALYFRLNGNKMIVHDDEDAAYKLDEILQTPKQFIEYTHQQCLITSPTAFANPLSALYNGHIQLKL